MGARKSAETEFDRETEEEKARVENEEQEEVFARMKRVALSGAPRSALANEEERRTFRLAERLVEVMVEQMNFAQSMVKRLVLEVVV